MRVLGIETSCDETAVALYGSESGLIAHTVYSQIDLHALWGGVVPELASRDHARMLAPLVQRFLEPAEGSPQRADAIAYTKGPGLIGPLMVGAVFSKHLGLAWNVPVIGIHHLEGHLLAPKLEENAPRFPYLALLVSGGHTQIVDVRGVGDYEILGESMDDAAGEAFDKTAKILGLPYPGGAKLAALALKGREGQFKFTRPLRGRGDLEFSFSGLKTAAWQAFANSDQSEQSNADLALAFELTMVDALVHHCVEAIKRTRRTCMVVAGGVGANQRLRATLASAMSRLGVAVAYPRSEFCTDNAAMIALAGYERLKHTSLTDLVLDEGPWAVARWPLSQLQPPQVSAVPVSSRP